MKYEKYDINASTENTEYYFTSSRRKGNIPKVIQYTEISPQAFNLAFGIHKPDDTVDDITVSNNGDMHKVLATVGQPFITLQMIIPEY